MNLFSKANAQPYTLPPAQSAPAAAPSPANAPQDPLAQLADIYMPEPIEGFPWAIGWWGVLGISLILLSLIALFLWRRHRSNQFKRDALAELQTIVEQYSVNTDQQEASANCYQRLNQLLRRVVIHKDASAISLTGQAWANYLSQQGSLDAEQAQRLVQAAYQAQPEDPTPLFMPIERWLKKYRGAARA